MALFSSAVDTFLFSFPIRCFLFRKHRSTTEMLPAQEAWRISGEGLFTRVRGRGILGTLHTASCIPPVPQGRRPANRSGPALAAEHYIVWWCIKMRCSE